MKKAIIFETKTGTTQNCAELLKETIGEIDIYNIGEKQVPNIDDYELIVFGGAYYAGMIGKKLRKYIKNNKENLKNKRYAFYVCCASEDDYIQYLSKNVGEDIVKNSVLTECFGYQVNIANSKGFTKFILKIMQKAFEKENKPMNGLKQDKIEKFAKVIKDF